MPKLSILHRFRWKISVKFMGPEHRFNRFIRDNFGNEPVNSQPKISQIERLGGQSEKNNIYLYEFLAQVQ